MSHLFQPRTCAFFMVTGTTLACAAGAYVLDMVEAKAGNKRSIGSAPMEKASDALDCLASFLNRVPDELELIHRCATQPHLLRRAAACSSSLKLSPCCYFQTDTSPAPPS